MGLAQARPSCFLGPGPAPGRRDQPLPLLAVLDPDACVGLRRDRPQLALQLAVAAQAFRVERAIRQSRLDRAPGLGVVGAVGEAAPKGQLLDVLEDAAERV